jgi:prolyl 4-hydroxylase
MRLRVVLLALAATAVVLVLLLGEDDDDAAAAAAAVVAPVPPFNPSRVKAVSWQPRYINSATSRRSQERTHMHAD